LIRRYRCHDRKSIKSDVLATLRSARHPFVGFITCYQNQYAFES